MSRKTDKPLLLDLFCGAGISAIGWNRAGFEVVGVDIKPQKRYPFQFILADALTYVAAHGHEYSAVVASPPCQQFSKASRLAGKHRKEHPNLIPQTRALLQALGKPYLIENVKGAPLLNPVEMCGAWFPNVWTYRHRYFESSVMLLTPPHIPHDDNCPPAGRGYSRKGFVSICAGGIRGVNKRQRLDTMGVDRYVTNYELAQAYPPAYAEYLGRQLIQYVREELRKGKE